MIRTSGNGIFWTQSQSNHPNFFIFLLPIPIMPLAKGFSGGGFKGGKKSAPANRSKKPKRDKDINKPTTGGKLRWG